VAESCGGCQFHKYPYKAEIPVLIDGKREKRTFTCDEDVWAVIDLLIEEVKQHREEGKQFDIAQSVNAQIPFFACRNIIFDKELQKDIQRYVYCNESGVPPYNGSYNEQPAIWIEKFFIIKNTFAKKEKEQIDARSKQSNNS
tara:strand:- start:436 stop:861 length:426 start_codon:yes stop_codon:yes gene_type:complete